MLILFPIVLDIISGIVLLLAIKRLAFLFGMLLLLKALFSIISSFKSGFFFEFMGFTDLVGALSLILFSFGIHSNIYPLIAFALLSKGIFSFLLTSRK